MKRTVEHGQRFGKLVVIRRFADDDIKKVRVRCDCGVEKSVSEHSLKTGNTRSCGCLAVTGKVTHGMSNTPEYSCWQLMRERCNNPNSSPYQYYGAKGVVVCDRWNDSFEAFFEDMGPKPGPEYSIDRYPDTFGNYEPGNCRWATLEQQANNRRNTVYVDVDGERLCLKDAAEKLGRDPIVLYREIFADQIKVRNKTNRQRKAASRRERKWAYEVDPDVREKAAAEIRRRMGFRR